MTLAGLLKVAQIGKTVHGAWVGNKVGAKLFPQWAERRQAKKDAARREAEAAGGQWLYEDDEDIEMNPLAKELLLSAVRHFAPAASAFLAGAGIELGDGTSPVVTVTVAVVVYGVMQGWSFVRKWRRAKAAPAA